MLQVNDKVYGIDDDNEIIELIITNIFKTDTNGQPLYCYRSSDGKNEDLFYGCDLDIKRGIYFSTRELAEKSLQED